MKAESCYYIVSALNEFALEVPYLSYYIFRTLGLRYVYLFIAISSLIYGFLDYPTGGLADKFGRKLIFIVGLIFSAFSIILLAFIANSLTIIFASILGGLGGALRSDSLEAWITDEMKNEGKLHDLDRIFGRSVSLSLMADVLAGGLGSLVTFLGNYWLTLLVGGLSMLITAFITIIVMRENYGEGKRKSYFELLRDGAAFIFTRKSLLILGVSQTLFMAGLYVYWEALPPIYSVRGIPEFLFGVIGGVMHIPAMLTAAYTYLLIRKLGVFRAVTILSWFWAFLCALMAFLISPLQTVLLVVFLESVYATRHPVVEYWRNILIPSRVRATVLSGLSTMVHAGQSLILLLLSPLTEIYGASFALFSAVFLTAISNLTFSLELKCHE